MTTPRLARLDDPLLLKEWEAEAEAAVEARRTGVARGPVTGLPSLDRDLGGALGVGQHYLHGGPGVGKTAFALQLAASCAVPALYISCEMGLLALARRHTARETSTFLGRLTSGELPPAASVQLLERAAAASPGLVFADATRAPASPLWIVDAAEAVRGESRHLVIVVDSVHAWAQGIAGDAPEYEALNRGLAALGGIASTLACAVLGIAERNRGTMERGGLSASAGTRKFEYGAESVLELDRKKDTPPDANGEVAVTLTIAKNRHGGAGRSCDLSFNGALQRFQEVR